MAILLGIDPGLATIGFGVIKHEKGNSVFMDCGVIKTAPTLSFIERLALIQKDFESILEEFKPDALGIEELFFSKNVTNGLQVAHARGVLLLSAHKHHLPVYEFTPIAVKQNITGFGGADKKQMKAMVQRLLRLPQGFKSDDAADALGIALMAARQFEQNLKIC